MDHIIYGTHKLYEQFQVQLVLVRVIKLPNKMVRVIMLVAGGLVVLLQLTCDMKTLGLVIKKK